MESRFRITGMQCAACSASVERAVGRLEGVSVAEVNLLAGLLRCVYEAPATPEKILAAVERAGFGAAD